MIKIGILGDIGSGKSFVAKNFRYPVFNADKVVADLYKKDKKIFIRLKKKLPKYFYSFPIDKKDVSNAILSSENNLRKIVKMVHAEVRKKMSLFIKNNKKKKIIILDIPLLLENKINKKKDILIFVQSSRKEILKRLKKRNNFNKKIVNKFRNIQLPLDYKRNRSHFIIKNDFTEKKIKKIIKEILKKIL